MILIVCMFATNKKITAINMPATSDVHIPSNNVIGHSQCTNTVINFPET
jgi:hypothetical protein